MTKHTLDELAEAARCALSDLEDAEDARRASIRSLHYYLGEIQRVTAPLPKTTQHVITLPVSVIPTPRG